MAFLTPKEKRFAQSISNLGFCNPFLPERIEYEREALGDDFLEVKSVWSRQTNLPVDSPNVLKIVEWVAALAELLRDRLVKGARPAGDEEAGLYEDLILFFLFHRYHLKFRGEIIKRPETGPARRRFDFFREFERDARRFYEPSGRSPRFGVDHLFAGFYQIRRAFEHIFQGIIGGSMPAARLRASVWQSIFTHDMRRYWRALYDRMGDVTTLITGPSGTGKELVAQAIGLSRYIPFDPRTMAFAEDFADSFHALNISALAPTLIESELFGHCKGAFTGAAQDRAGWLEVCTARGTVFLDEIGEIDGSIQVKFLRVLQERTFQRLGETKDRAFRGKIVAATNRDLAEEAHAGHFREDLYYRLCSDIIVTPSLAEQTRESPETLPNLIHFVAGRLVGAGEAPSLTDEVAEWIKENVGTEYSWPGNVRELEQCVRNVLIRKAYHPLRPRSRTPEAKLAETLKESSLSADELLRLYCTLVHAQTGNYQETARRLNLDHRTVKSKIDPELLERCRTGGCGP